MEGVRMDRFLKRLPQQILAALGIGHVLENREHDIVPHEALGSAEEAKVPHNNAALIGGELVGFPQLDVLLHRHLVGHPMVFAAVEVVLPRPFVFDGHQLIDVHGLAVDEQFVLGVDALGEVVRLGGLIGDITTRHSFPFG